MPAIDHFQRGLRSADVLEWMAKAIEKHGAPGYLRSDNWSEFIANIVQQWLAENQVKTIYIDPGSPWQNGFVESFHGRFRDECLNREQLWTPTEARVVIEDHRRQYNEFRPHSKLGYQSPADFAAQAHPASAPVGLGRAALFGRYPAVTSWIMARMFSTGVPAWMLWHDPQM